MLLFLSFMAALAVIIGVPEFFIRRHAAKQHKLRMAALRAQQKQEREDFQLAVARAEWNMTKYLRRTNKELARSRMKKMVM